MTKVTTCLIHDTRRAKNSEKYPVKLRLIYNRVVKYYPTNIDLSKEEFTKLSGPKLRKEYKDLRDKLSAIEVKAKEVINTLTNFSFKAFENKFYITRSPGSDLMGSYSHYIDILRLSGRIGTAISCECSLNSIKAFKSPLHFEDITIDFLREYENWMLKKGNSITTVGIYLRALRSVFNEAISDNIILKDLYPFGKRKYQIPTGRNTKKALLLSDIKKIYDYETSLGSWEEKGKDFWLFSYLCNGINMKDIARLKFKNIDGDYITFVRAKTERTTRSNPKPISIYLHDRAREIIKRWGNKNKLSTNYIFPILEFNCSAEREQQLIQQFIKQINKWIKHIAHNVGIDKNVTTYTARHSFSTVLKRSGASVEFISEALGHTDVRTTESYLDSFESEAKKLHAASLVAF